MEENTKINKSFDGATMLGVALLLSGIIVFAEIRINSGWLMFLLPPGFGILALYNGVKLRRRGFLLLASMSLFLGLGAIFLFSPFLRWELNQRLGICLIVLGMSWWFYGAITHRLIGDKNLWVMLPGNLLFCLGVVFLRTQIHLLDFVLWASIGAGSALLAWGYLERLIGLIIPGCLVVSTGVGVFLGWNQASPETTALAKTGVMLIIIGIGWAFITLFSKRVFDFFVWWPLIPALVIGVTGWGLYIGGNPAQAGRFIGNTGSITLLILGAYVLLLRRGFRR